jgi:hypothetical protein
MIGLDSHIQVQHFDGFVNPSRAVENPSGAEIIIQGF